MAHSSRSLTSPSDGSVVRAETFASPDGGRPSLPLRSVSSSRLLRSPSGRLSQLRRTSSIREGVLSRDSRPTRESALSRESVLSRESSGDASEGGVGGGGGGGSQFLSPSDGHLQLRPPDRTTSSTTSSQSSSSFFVMITGHIEAAKSTCYSWNDRLYCRYAFSHGPDWEVVHGVSMGLSQVGRPGLQAANDDGSDVVVWNFPIEISFRSTNPHGWPRLALSVYGFDFLGRDVLRGYASLLLPPTPGRHAKYLTTYRPVSGSAFVQFANWLMGTNPEYYDSKMSTRGEGRAVTRVAGGDRIVKVQLTVTLKDFPAFGYSAPQS
ncbi:hypothetical protein ACHAWF_016922 [Thalassiosira exigua]